MNVLNKILFIFLITEASLTISGSKFGSSAGTVSLGTNEATITSWSDTAITVEVALTTAGDLPLLIVTGDGLAVNTG